MAPTYRTSVGASAPLRERQRPQLEARELDGQEYPIHRFATDERLPALAAVRLNCRTDD
jgi:hypothetical protein